MKNNTVAGNVCSLMLAGAVLAGTAGCSVLKKGRSELQLKQEVRQLQTDSLLIGSHKKIREQSIHYFRQIHLSPPDSAGRQYIQTLTQAVSAAGRTEARRDSLSLQSAIRTALHSENRQKEYTATNRTSFGWKWVMAGLLVLGVGYILKLRKKAE